MFPPTKSTKDTDPKKMSATTLTLVSGSGKSGAVQGALLAGKSHVKPRSAGRNHTANLEVKDEENRALASKMADTIEHYTEERKIVHLNIQPKWKRKLSTGWTINRPLLYPKTPPPNPFESHRGSQGTPAGKADEQKPSCLESDGHTLTNFGAHNDGSENESKGTGPRRNSIQINIEGSDKDLEHVTDKADSKENESDTSNSESGTETGVDDKSTQCEPPEQLGTNTEKMEPSKEEQKREDEPSPRKFHANITDRSKSNDILNFISVDDCKMVMRYRPRRVIDTQDTMILPSSSGKHDHVPISDWDRNDLITSSKKNTDQECSTQNTPIRLSQGTEKTTLSPSQVQSRVQAYRDMYNTYSNRKAEDKVQRPSSAAVEKAFEVLLDRNLKPSKGRRVRPHSSPAVLPRARPGSGRTQSSDSSCHEPIFQHLNAKLRRQMYDMVDTQWYRTKLKFQRCKSGYAKTKSRLPVQFHQPRLSWMSDEAFDQE
nr:hypothetical protein BaRGS_006740 [Batillaria attramentaria]